MCLTTDVIRKSVESDENLSFGEVDFECMKTNLRLDTGLFKGALIFKGHSQTDESFVCNLEFGLPDNRVGFKIHHTNGQIKMIGDVTNV